MQKKGWKCWAKVLSRVKEPANSGFDWEGEFANVGETREMEAGEVLLHVDDSSSHGIGVVIPGSAAGKGRIVWLETTSGKWASSLARGARKLLALTPDERVRWAAKQYLADIADDSAIGDAVKAHYRRLAGVAEPAAAPPAELAAELSAESSASPAAEAPPAEPFFSADAIAAQIQSLLAGLTHQQVAAVYRLLPAVEHRD